MEIVVRFWSSQRGEEEPQFQEVESETEALIFVEKHLRSYPGTYAYQMTFLEGQPKRRLGLGDGRFTVGYGDGSENCMLRDNYTGISLKVKNKDMLSLCKMLQGCVDRKAFGETDDAF